MFQRKEKGRHKPEVCVNVINILSGLLLVLGTGVITVVMQNLSGWLPKTTEKSKIFHDHWRRVRKMCFMLCKKSWDARLIDSLQNLLWPYRGRYQLPWEMFIIVRLPRVIKRYPTIVSCIHGRCTCTVVFGKGHCLRTLQGLFHLCSPQGNASLMFIKSMQILTWQPRPLTQTQSHGPAIVKETISYIPN